MNWDTVISISLRLLAVVFLVLLNAFFVATEFALVKVRETQLFPLIAAGNRRARLAGFVLNRLDAFLGAAQLGITVVSLALGWIGEPVFSALLTPVFDWFDVSSKTLRHVISISFGFSLLTFLHISAGEQAPKLLAIRKPLPTTLWVAYPIALFYYLSYPFVWSLNRASHWMLRQAGLQPEGEGESETSQDHSPEELRLIVGASQRGPGESAIGREILLNALDLKRRVVREVMRPRQEITLFDTEAPIAECLDVAERSRFSRFPLCEGGDVDKTIGVVHIKDLYALRLRARTGADLAPAARKLIYVPETGRLEKLLHHFLDRRLHLAIVVDEYGGTLGIVTLENILEELVGQIQDEFDQEKPLLVATGANTWEASGTLPLHQLEELAGTPLQQEGVTTVSGWISAQFGGFPKVGDVARAGACELSVVEMDGMRVARLKVTRATQLSSDAKD